MKEGFYIRYVPVIDEWTYYCYYDESLIYLTSDAFWMKSSHDKPSKQLGFKKVIL